MNYFFSIAISKQINVEPFLPYIYALATATGRDHASHTLAGQLNAFLSAIGLHIEADLFIMFIM